MAVDGELDPVLTLPVRPLVYLLTKRVDTSLLGDLLFGPMLFFTLAGPTWERTAIYIVGSLASATVLVAFLVLLGALTLLIGGKGEQSDLGFQAVLVFSSYPLDIFGGATRFMLYTAIPAAFVTGLPVRLVEDFQLETLVVLLGGTALFGLLAAVCFKLGLERSSSGALWTRA